MAGSDSHATNIIEIRHSCLLLAVTGRWLHRHVWLSWIEAVAGSIIVATCDRPPGCAAALAGHHRPGPRVPRGAGQRFVGAALRGLRERRDGERGAACRRERTAAGDRDRCSRREPVRHSPDPATVARHADRRHRDRRRDRCAPLCRSGRLRVRVSGRIAERSDPGDPGRDEGRDALLAAARGKLCGAYGRWRRTERPRRRTPCSPAAKRKSPR